VSAVRANRQATPAEPLVRAVESASFLDGPGDAIGGSVRKLLAPRALKEALSGTWLGHAVHPLLTDVVIGSFLSATALDLIGGAEGRAASEKLIAIGIAAYAPTALTGVNDWADSEATDEPVRRGGLVHAATNAGALGLYAASWRARRRGSMAAGVGLGALGATMLGLGAYLGGHLSYARGLAVDQTVFDPGPEEWSAVPADVSVTEGRPARAVVGDTPVLLIRHGGEVQAIHDRCSHRGCSLSDGEIEGDEVICSCHGSRFALADGAVRRGPATAPQPSYDVREHDGRLELRLASAG
jgi:nitrite reductase/ring-hydroxylating ferredoxin subunit/uncharacterized membrane protein